jgi:hypothetical protein
MRLRVGLGVVLAAAALGSVPALASTGPTLTASILPTLNGDRIANGLPPAPVVNQAMEQGCANHDHYMALNNVLEHGENPTRSGYTPAGANLDAAQGGESIAEDQGWSLHYEPWRSAPIHLYGIMDPTGFQVGYADSGGFQCLRVRGNDQLIPGYAPPVAPAFYAWTSDTGRSGVPAAERAAEDPYTPQQMVGLPAGQTTGPNILLFSAGDLGTPESATLRGPEGPVQVVLVNHDTHNRAGPESWFYGGGVLIPVHPLRPFTSYTATVSWQDQGPQMQQFSFKTGGRVVWTRISLSERRDHRGRIRLTAFGTPRLLLALAGPRDTLSPRLKAGHTGWLTLARGRWHACADSADPTHPAASACIQFNQR